MTRTKQEFNALPIGSLLFNGSYLLMVSRKSGDDPGIIAKCLLPVSQGDQSYRHSHDWQGKLGS